MKKILNITLLICFIIVIMVSLTGTEIHNLASKIFFLLCIAHVIVYRNKLWAKRWWLFIAMIICFATGLFGTGSLQYPLLLTLHSAIAIGIVFFLAIHIFIYRKKYTM